MMTGAISLAAGIVIGLLYALLKVRSPAPPAIALIGLLGMLSGEKLVAMVAAPPTIAAEPVTAHPATAASAALYTRSG
jgi:XapX domain-containing protein